MREENDMPKNNCPHGRRRARHTAEFSNDLPNCWLIGHCPIGHALFLITMWPEPRRSYTTGVVCIGPTALSFCFFASDWWEPDIRRVREMWQVSINQFADLFCHAQFPCDRLVPGFILSPFSKATSNPIIYIGEQTKSTITNGQPPQNPWTTSYYKLLRVNWTTHGISRHKYHLNWGILDIFLCQSAVSWHCWLWG